MLNRVGKGASENKLIVFRYPCSNSVIKIYSALWVILEVVEKKSIFDHLICICMVNLIRITCDADRPVELAKERRSRDESACNSGH